MNRAIPGPGLGHRLGSHRNMEGISTRCEKKNLGTALRSDEVPIPGRGSSEA